MTQPDSAARPVKLRCQSCRALNRIDLARLSQHPKCAKCRAVFALDRPQPVDDADLLTVTASATVPVLVDLYADWCGPCQAMAPALEQFAAANAGRVLVLKLDTDANPQTGQRLGIRGIPTLISYRGGKELRRHVGMAGAEVLRSLVS